jgi:hypothetical protein
MVSDRSLQHVDDAGSVFMVVNRAEDATRLDGHHTHPKLAPCHAFDLRAKVNTVARNFTVTPFVSGATGSLLIVLSSLYFHGLAINISGGAQRRSLVAVVRRNRHPSRSSARRGSKVIGQ